MPIEQLGRTIVLMAISRVDDSESENVEVNFCAHHSCRFPARYFATLKILGVDYLLFLCDEHKDKISLGVD